MDKAEKRTLCYGCRNNYYNLPGNSTTGECWMLKTAKPVERTRVGVWQNPPYRWNPATTLSCHTPENSTTWIEKTDVRIQTSVLTDESYD